MELLTRLRRVATRIEGGVRSAVLAAFSLALLPGASAADADSVEYPVKAAYLTKFGIYVDWPAAAFSAPGSPFSLCIAGDDPFGATLDAAVNGQRIGDRPIQVRRLKAVGRDSACHILYVGSSDAPRAAQLVDAVRGSPVLTVSDARTGAGGTGIINFVIKDNRVRFNIDEDAAAQNGLSVSSKLLGLALAVKFRAVKEAR